MVDWSKYTTEQIIEKFADMSLSVAAEARTYIGKERNHEEWKKFVDSGVDEKYIENLKTNNRVAEYIMTGGNSLKNADNIAKMMWGIDREGDYSLKTDFLQLSEKIIDIKINAEFSNPEEYAKTDFADMDKFNLQEGKIEHFDKKLPHMSLEQLASAYIQLESNRDKNFDAIDKMEKIQEKIKNLPAEKFVEYANQKSHNINNAFVLETMLLDKENPAHKQAFDSISGLKEDLKDSSSWKNTPWNKIEEENKQSAQEHEKVMEERKRKELEEKEQKIQQEKADKEAQEAKQEQDIANKKNNMIYEEYNYSLYEKKYALELKTGREPKESFQDYLKSNGGNNTVFYGDGERGLLIRKENSDFTRWKKEKGYDNQNSDASKKLDVVARNNYLKSPVELKMLQNKMQNNLKRD